MPSPRWNQVISGYRQADAFDSWHRSRVLGRTCPVKAKKELVMVANLLLKHSTLKEKTCPKSWLLVSPCFTRLYILNNTFSIEPSLDQSVWLKLAPEPCRSLTFRLAPTHTIKKAFAMISKFWLRWGVTHLSFMMFHIESCWKSGVEKHRTAQWGKNVGVTFTFLGTKPWCFKPVASTIYHM